MNDLPPFARTIGVIAWCSFLVAAAATGVCFGLLDPMAVVPDDMPHWWTSRRTVYAAGFFFFWLIAAGSGALTVYMSRSEAR